MGRPVTLLLLLALTTLAYQSAWTAGFVYEDRNPLISLDPTAGSDLRGGWEGWAIESSHVRLVPRALSNLTMRVQGWAGAEARGYHLVNLAVHEVNGLLVYALLLPIMGAWALVGAALFLLHPLNSQAVLYVSARPDLLAGTAVLLMLLASRVRGWGVLLAALCGGLAMLAKESAIVVVLLLPLWLWYERRLSRVWLWTVSPLVLGVAVVAVRLFRTAGSIMGVHSWHAISAYTSPAPDGPFWFAAVQAAAGWRMVGLFLVPSGFSIDHDWARVTHPLALLALASLGLVIGLAWVGRRIVPDVSFVIAWVVGALAPRFLIPLPEFVTEHQMYVPLIGLCLGAAVFVHELQACFSDARIEQYRSA